MSPTIANTEAIGIINVENSGIDVEYEAEIWKDYPDPNFNPEITPENPNFNDPEYRTKRNTITI